MASNLLPLQPWHRPSALLPQRSSNNRRTSAMSFSIQPAMRLSTTTAISRAPIVWDGTACRIVTAIDVTERKRAEEELRANQAQLRTVFENLGEGIIVSDLKGNLLQWNRAAVELHGYNDEDRRHLTELVDTFVLGELDGTPLSVDDWPLARILRGETIHDLELRVKDRKSTR